MATKNKLKIVFIDRDGVINRFPGHGDYVKRVRDFHFIPQSRRAIARLTQAGYKIIIISNQAGVGRGKFTQATLDKISAKMLKGIKESKGKITGIYYCTHKPDAGCDCRKPGIGNIKKALKDLGLSLASIKGSYFIGDTDKDMQTAQAAGLKSILVTSGHDGHTHHASWTYKPDMVVMNLNEAVEVMLI